MQREAEVEPAQAVLLVDLGIAITGGQPPALVLGEPGRLTKAAPENVPRGS